MSNFLQSMKNAEIDAQSLSQFVNGSSAETVPRRLAPEIRTLAYYLDLLERHKRDLGQIGGVVINDYKETLNRNLTNLTQKAQNDIAALAEQAIAAEQSRVNQKIKEFVDDVVLSQDVPSATFIKTSNGRTLQDKLQDVRSLDDFYRAGESNYSQAMMRALQSDACVIDGGGKSYDISGSFVIRRSNLRLQNMTLNITDAQKNSTLFTFSGTEDAAVAVNNSTLFSAMVDNVSEYAIDDYVYLSNNQKWSPTVSMGEVTQIESVDYVNGIIYFRFGLIGRYNAENEATIKKITHVKNIYIDNVIINGVKDDSLSNNAFAFIRCENVMIHNTYTHDFDARHYIIDHCVNVRMTGGAVHRTGDKEGLDYGVAIVNASLNVIIDGLSGTQVRHLVAIGGYKGVNKHLTIKNCRAFNTSDAAFDAHSAAADVEFLFNHSNQSGSDDTQQDGIIIQCASAKLVGNVINNPRRHGIVFTPEINDGVYNGKIGCESAINRINYTNSTTGSSSGFLVTTDSTASGIDFVSSIGDVFGGSHNGYFIRASQADIRSVTIQSSRSTQAFLTRAIHLISSSRIENIIIDANNMSVLSNNECVYLQSTGGTFSQCQITGNNLAGSGSAIRLTNTHQAVESNNITTGFQNFLLMDARCLNIQSATPNVAKQSWTTGTIENNARKSINITMPGVQMGDIVNVGIDKNLQGCQLFAQVTGSNLVTAFVQNNTGVTKTIEPCVITVATRRYL